ncbi:7240_t:CDS:1, partial [Ambispora gerdemannii]
CCFSAAMQTKNPNVPKLSASGKFSSIFVTCIVTGNENGEVDVHAYQVSSTCKAMVAADIMFLKYFTSTKMNMVCMYKRAQSLVSGQIFAIK